VLSAAAVLLVAGIVLSAAYRFTSPDGARTPGVTGPGGPESAEPAAPPGPPVYPAALFVFEERGAGARELGAKVTDLLFAKLAAREGLNLVDRADLQKTLAEAELNLSGVVKPDDATKVGQLTGAKLLITGSVLHVDKRLFLVAKIIGTETSQALAASVDGKVSDELDTLVTQLADKVAEIIARRAPELVAKVVNRRDRLTALNEQLKKAKRPVLWLRVVERHVGAATFDPAAQTELTLMARGAGFEVIDPDEGRRGQAEVLVTGEGISQLASRHGNLVTVKARLEVKAVERTTDRVLAVDRQTAVVVDLTEQLAGKAALQEAAAAIAERMLPRLVKTAGGEKRP
jgi:TolB-like protein